MKAIKDTGNNLIAALDPNDSIGILDSYFPNADFFTEFERFDRFLEKFKREGNNLDYVSICSPNYLHDAHIRYGLKIGAKVICEKPIVLNPWNLESLEKSQNEYAGEINNIMQLRLHPELIQLRESVKADTSNKIHKVKLKYISARGKWYHVSWKGEEEKSGGLASNIGIHFFDVLIWIFGRVISNKNSHNSSSKIKGTLNLERAVVEWDLSINSEDLPSQSIEKGDKTFKYLYMDGQEIDLNYGFENLHTESYYKILEGKGFGLSDIKPVIDLVYKIRNDLA